MVVSNDVVHDPRVLKEARALRSAGHEVAFIGWDRSGRGPAQGATDGFSLQFVRTSGLMRALGKDLLRNPVWWRRAIRLARQQNFDVVHCHDLDTLPVGVSLTQKGGKRLVYDAHEVFGYMIEAEVPKFVVDYTFRMERRLAPQADRIIAVNDSVKEYVDRASGKQATVVRNAAELRLTEYREPRGPPFTLIYLGTLHQSRYILPAIEVVGSLPDVRLVIGGSKQLTPQVEAMCQRYPNTQFVGMVPAERVLPMTVDSHAVLTMFDPAYRINQVGLPNKIFEAMAAGRPSIVTEGLPMSKIVVQEQCGLAVPYTKEGLRNAIERLRDDRAFAGRLGRKGLEAAKREYNWDAEARKLIAVYDGLERAG